MIKTIMNGFVSVIIPVFDGQRYVREAVDSALAQSYAQQEVIVVNDGSTDTTSDILRSYGSQIKVIEKANGGTSSALNAGIREATGEYIAWLSHDDLFLPEKTSVQVAYLKQHPDVAACHTDFLFIDAAGNTLHTAGLGHCRDSRQGIRRLFAGNFINGSTLLFRKAIFDRLGLFREDLRYVQDFDMLFRIFEAYDIGYIGEVMGKSRIHAAQQGRRKFKAHRAEALNLLRETFERCLRKGLLDRGRTEELLWFADVLSGYGYYGEASRTRMQAIRSGHWRVLGRASLGECQDALRAARQLALAVGARVKRCLR